MRVSVRGTEPQGRGGVLSESRRRRAKAWEGEKCSPYKNKKERRNTTEDSRF